MEEEKKDDQNEQAQTVVADNRPGTRPGVKTYSKTSKFRPGDSVYVVLGDGSREGPYLVETVPSVERYTLCLENGLSARSGAEIDEKDLVAV